MAQWERSHFVTVGVRSLTAKRALIGEVTNAPSGGRARATSVRNDPARPIGRAPARRP